MDTKDIGNLSRCESLTAAGATTAVAVIAESPNFIIAKCSKQ